MNMNYRGIVLVVGFLTASVAAEIFAEPDRAPVAFAANGRLRIGARIANTPLYREESPILLIGFHNISDQALALPVTDFLGVKTIGLYQFELINRTTGSTYRVGLDPDAPLPDTRPRSSHITVAPTAIYQLNLTLPGPAKQFLATAENEQPMGLSPKLPAGEYTLHLTIRLPRETVNVGPVMFAVIDQLRPKADQPPLKPSDRVISVAERFLSDRLAFHRKVSPNNPTWRQLRASSFHHTTRWTDLGWKIEYRSDDVQDGRVVQLTVTVDDRGKVIFPEADFHLLSAESQRSR